MLRSQIACTLIVSRRHAVSRGPASGLIVAIGDEAPHQLSLVVGFCRVATSAHALRGFKPGTIHRPLRKLDL